ncbi:MAG TPA: type VI secretion system lipoprotein TssJ [Burkholderiaceae bacterium]|nr:type VI secretion system lipoprotein TssJ [Burkholderiaceae bacterium]
MQGGFHTRWWRAGALLGALAGLVLSSGCAATKAADEVLGDLTKSLLEKTGLKKPEPPALPQADVLRLPREIPLRIHAGAELNHDSSHRPLSLLVRIYKLKNASAFQQAPYEAFIEPGRDKQFFGDDLLESRELLLVPGQRLEAKEKVPREASAVGIVALFHAPAPQRWKVVFDAAQVEQTGIAVAAHGCSMSVVAGKPVGAQVDLSMVGGARCRP